uniref:Uncharacterized protein n=1 Tax=Crepidomanes minutum TaxID=32127 RepID=A0A8K1VNR3_9MONI|nr:hypothetical protein Ycf94 [Crepidomanes minutum]UEQ13166.1 hypothetical protein Ycf94 [Crepidomanes minutum]
MGSVYILSQMLFYYPFLFFLFYIYIIFVIPLKSHFSIKECWLSIKSFFETDYSRIIDSLRNGNSKKH